MATDVASAAADHRRRSRSRAAQQQWEQEQEKEQRAIPPWRRRDQKCQPSEAAKSAIPKRRSRKQLEQLEVKTLQRRCPQYRPIFDNPWLMAAKELEAQGQPIAPWAQGAVLPGDDETLMAMLLFFHG